MIASAGLTETEALKRAHLAPSLETDGFWYLATPYSKFKGGIHEAFILACEAAGKLMTERGLCVYSPIAESHPIAQMCGLDPLDHGIWLPACAPKMAAAHGLLVVEMPGWQDSVGVRHEIENFKAKGKPVHYLEWPRLNVRHG